MINNQHLNDLADKLTSALPEGLKSLQSDAKDNMKAVLESSLRQMNLVSREEFDVQSALLQRTLSQLEALEQQVQALEQHAK